MVPKPPQLARAVIDFYRDPISWLALVITSVMLCYVGGAAMFWFHAEYLGELGPAIPWYDHWALDSTFAFILLTPALVVIMPLTAWLANRTAGKHGPDAVPWAFAAAAGAAFAVATIPGPLAHDLFMGRGTWLANHVTQWLGYPPAPPVLDHEHGGALAAFAQQFGFGLPLYIVLTFLALVLVHSITVRRVQTQTEAPVSVS